jgi:single-strand DNA-binding protein
MKTISIAGNIGKDALTRTTPTGDTVTSWTVAVEDRHGKEKGTIWFDCSLWGKRGEALAQYLTKGGKVALSGELGKREHEGKAYLTIRVAEVSLMGGGQDREPRAETSRREPAGRKVDPLDDMSDEIPF